MFITVFLTAFAIGLVTTRATLGAAMGRRGFALVVTANLVVVPLVGYMVTTAFALDTGAKTGIVLCAICAGGPLALKAGQIARSDLVWTLSLTVALLVLNVVALPIWSSLLLSRSVALNLGDLVGVLLAAIVLPAGLGIWIGLVRPTAVAPGRTWPLRLRT